MIEATLRIPGRAGLRNCSISKAGRITLNETAVKIEGKQSIIEPFFTATLTELIMLRYMAQGLTVRETGLQMNRRESSVRAKLEDVRMKNSVQKTVDLVTLAIELDLLNSIAIEGIKAQKRLLKDRK